MSAIKLNGVFFSMILAAPAFGGQTLAVAEHQDDEIARTGFQELII